MLAKKKYEAQFQTNSFILNNKIKKPKIKDLKSIRDSMPNL